MGLPYSQLQILTAIEKELQADPQLEPAFCAFTRVTRNASMPATEQLRTPARLTDSRVSRRAGLPTFADGLIMAFAAIVVILLAVLIASRSGS
jgi:ferric-dicitrate binding protein FerR (iron transport regulator)